MPLRSSGSSSAWGDLREEGMRAPAVGEDLCIGCGYCQEICPRVFELFYKKSKVVGPDKCGTCNCQEAIDTCPVQAISWSGQGQ